MNISKIKKLSASFIALYGLINCVAANDIYTIYATQQIYKGNFSLYPPKENGLTGVKAADWICNNDAYRPTDPIDPTDRNDPKDSLRYFKAMISTTSSRHVRNEDGSKYLMDWVLFSGATYKNYNRSSGVHHTIGVATNSIIESFAEPLDPNANSDYHLAWTGMHSNWGITSDTCENWKSSSGGNGALLGDSRQKSTKAINTDNHDCDRLRSLYCVAQPFSKMMNSGTISGSSPITIELLAQNGVNVSTVNTSTFLVYPENDSYHSIAGGITVNSNNTFSFKSNTNLVVGKYKVKITDGIKDNQGNSLFASEFSVQVSDSSQFLIFLTKNNYWGGLGKIPGADSKCAADPHCPAGKICKALLTDGNLRKACTAKGYCGGDNSKDWVLQPNSIYYNINNENVGTTNGQAIFASNLLNPISTANVTVWTGFNTDFTSASKSNTCDFWSQGDGNYKKEENITGTIGNANSLGFNFISSSTKAGCSRDTSKSTHCTMSDINNNVQCSDADYECTKDAGCTERYLYCVVVPS